MPGVLSLGLAQGRGDPHIPKALTCWIMGTAGGTRRPQERAPDGQDNGEHPLPTGTKIFQYVNSAVAQRLLDC